MKDFFISYNQHDEAWAEWIAWQLEADNYKIVLQKWDFGPGGNFVIDMQRAAESTERVIVVLSGHFIAADFTQPEWAQAFARDPTGEKRLIIPVRIADCELPGFFKPLVYIDFFKLCENPPNDDEAELRTTLRQALLKGVERDRQKPQHEPPLPNICVPPTVDNEPDTAPPQNEPSATYFHHFKEALELDRTEQWTALTKQVQDGDSTFFLLHGEKRQNLEFFVARLWHYLNGEVGQHHRMIEIPLRVKYAIPGSAAAWENNLRDALGDGDGTAAELLAEYARREPLFLIIGRRPISRNDLQDEESALPALKTFLAERLPNIMQQASNVYASANPIRALLAIDYISGDNFADELHFAVHEGFPERGIGYSRLQQVTSVQWSHIESYLDRLKPTPPQDFYKKMKSLYASFDEETVSFRDLAEMLSQHI